LTPPPGGVNRVIETVEGKGHSMGAPEEFGMRAPEEAPEEAGMEAPEESTIPDGFVKNALVAASLGAGGIHIWAAWAHSSIPRVLIFFTLVATVQLWLAASVIWVRNVPWSVLIGGAVANAAVVVVWVLSRTTGVPFQPESMASMDAIMSRAISDPNVNRGAMAHQETFGFLDTAASLLEVGVVVAVLVLWRKRRSQGGESEMDETAGSSEDSGAPVSREVR
jgi:hypothetical protein